MTLRLIFLALAVGCMASGYREVEMMGIGILLGLLRTAMS